MGQDLPAVLVTNGERTTGKALLETDHILFRGENTRLKVPFDAMTSVEAVDDELRIAYPGGEAVLELGPQAEKWAHKILNPKSLLDKLGLRPGMRVSVVHVDDVDFWSELRARSYVIVRDEVMPDSDIIFLGVEKPHQMTRIAAFRERMNSDGAVWVVYRKGRKDFNENDVLRLGLETGLVDVKVVRFSDTHTATKFVIRKAERPPKSKRP